MSSLRSQIALPFAALFVLFGIGSSMFLLSDLERSLSDRLWVDIRLLRSTFELMRGENARRDTLWLVPIADNRIAAVISLDSTNVWPAIPEAARHRIAGIDNAGSIPPPEEFASHSSVGELFTVATEGASRRYAVLVPTRPSQGEYEAFALSVYGLTGFVCLFGVLLSVYIANRISSKVRRLTAFVNHLESDPEPDASGMESKELGLLQEALVSAGNRFRKSSGEISKLQVVRSQFLANVSHEVRTPLFSLKGFLETLLDGGVDDPTVNRQFLEKSLHHAERIDNLLRDLIEISRIESGEMRMSFRFFPLRSLFELAQSDHQDLAKSRSQELRAQLHDPTIEVLGDKERLREALANLVENALKYSPEGSIVSLTSSAEGDAVRISVRDAGPGIAPEHVGRIFERFYRVDPDRSRELGGTGLGLAIVKHIVEVHGSKMFVDSNLGHGTSFSFLLRTS